MSANTTPINYMISGTSEHDNVVFKDVSEFESDSDSNTSGDEENEENEIMKIDLVVSESLRFINEGTWYVIQFPSMTLNNDLHQSDEHG